MLLLLSIQSLYFLVPLALGLVVCSSVCGDIAFPESYLPVAAPGECPVDEERSCCISGVAFVTCDSAAIPENLTDTASIDTLKTAGKVTSFNQVIVTRNVPTPINFAAGCGKNILVAMEELVDIDVLHVSEDHQDEQYFHLFSLLNNKLGLVMQYEDDYTIMAQDWVDNFLVDGGAVGTLPTTQMGIQATMTIPPYLVPFAENEPCRWRMQFKLRYKGVLKSALVPAWIGQF